MGDLFLLFQLGLGGELLELRILRLVADVDHAGFLVLVDVSGSTFQRAAMQLISRQGVDTLPSASRVDGVRSWKPADLSSDSWLAASMLAQPANPMSPQTATINEASSRLEKLARF